MHMRLPVHWWQNQTDPNLGNRKRVMYGWIETRLHLSNSTSFWHQGQIWQAYISPFPILTTVRSHIAKNETYYIGMHTYTGMPSFLRPKSSYGSSESINNFLDKHEQVVSHTLKCNLQRYLPPSSQQQAPILWFTKSEECALNYCSSWSLSLDSASSTYSTWEFNTERAIAAQKAKPQEHKSNS